MNEERLLKRPILSFIVLSNVIFWLFLAIIGGGLFLKVPKLLTDILQIIAAWSSTFAFIILFKRIYPKSTLKKFIKSQFSTRISLPLLLFIITVQLLMFFIVLLLLPGKNLLVFDASLSGISMFIFLFITHLLRGPLGEELSWRGYLQSELQKKYTPLKASLFIGIVWGFWHTPLWFVSGYTGLNLLKYCLLFMIGIISISIIMTCFYNLSKNLLFPIVIHQLFNFLLALIVADLLDVLIYVMFTYFIAAMILVIINPGEALYPQK